MSDTIDHAQLAYETCAAARRKIRNEFQRNFPHYIPAPWHETSLRTWEDWQIANIRLHGREGFAERFPDGTLTRRGRSDR